MRVLLALTDPVALSYARSLLEDAGIPALEFDGHMNAVEGSIGILPRRLMVADADRDAARQVLAEAGLAHEIANGDGSGA